MTFFEVDRNYFYPSISQEELFKNNKKNKQLINILKLIIILFLIIIILIVSYMKIGFNIRFFKPQSNDDVYVEEIPGYYVNVYKENMYKYIALDGNEKYAYGALNEKDIKQMVWNHKELLGITAYKRFSGFYIGNPVALNQYTLKNEAGTIYGIMFVIKDKNDLYHYYYRRVWNKESNSVIFEENIKFMGNGKEIELNDFYTFSTSIDYTLKNNEFYLSSIRLYFN